MKKFLTVFATCLLILASVCVASAEESATKPILFRGIEWGSSYTEVLAQFPAEIRFFNTSYDGTSYNVRYKMLDESRHYYDGNVSRKASAYSSSLENLNVAGYELSDLDLCFAWIPGDDGLIVEDDDHTALFFAEYEISPKDLDAAYSDLTAKLSSLYGEPVSTKTSGFTIKETYTVWYGGNNTMLVLLKEEYSSGSKYIKIRYGTTDGDTWLQTAYDALILKESLETVSNIDGL